jgi:guanylate kinase
MEQALGYQRIVTYTTRPMRPGEKDGKDYYFIKQEEFDDLDYHGFFAETTTYDVYWGFFQYGSAKQDYHAFFTKKLIILNPAGAITARNNNINSYIVWLDLPAYFTMQRALNRGDEPLEICRRFQTDEKDFALFGQDEVNYDLRITTPTRIQDMADMIEKGVRRKCSEKS